MCSFLHRDCSADNYRYGAAGSNSIQFGVKLSVVQRCQILMTKVW